MLDAPTVPTTSFTLEYDRTAGGTEVSTAVAKLPEDVEIRLRIADHFLYVGELPNVDRRVTILAYPTAGARYVEGTTRRVERPRTWHSQWSADFYGVVEDVGVDPFPDADAEFDVLDVGVGSIYVHPSIREELPASDSPLEIGDGLYVPASPLEVWGLDP